MVEQSVGKQTIGGQDHNPRHTAHYGTFLHIVPTRARIALYWKVRRSAPWSRGCGESPVLPRMALSQATPQTRVRRGSERQVPPSRRVWLIFSLILRSPLCSNDCLAAADNFFPKEVTQK